MSGAQDRLLVGALAASRELPYDERQFLQLDSVRLDPAVAGNPRVLDLFGEIVVALATGGERALLQRDSLVKLSSPCALGACRFEFELGVRELAGVAARLLAPLTRGLLGPALRRARLDREARQQAGEALDPRSELGSRERPQLGVASRVEEAV